MKSREVSLAVVLAAVCASLIGCPDDSRQVCLWGRVDLNEPIDGSTVTVQEATSGAVLAEAQTTDGDFLDFLSRDAFPAGGKDLLLTATGGTVNGEPFEGTLKAYVPAYVVSDHIPINILTTLIAEYMAMWGEPYDQACQDVFDYYGLPRDYSFLDVAHQDNAEMQFEPERFLEDVEAYGGLAEYVTYLVENEIGWEDVPGEDYSALYVDEADPGAKQVLGTMAAAVGKWIGGKILDSVGSWAAEQGLGWVLSLFGFQDSNDARFDAIDQKLDVMDGKLDTILGDLSSISAQLDDVLAAVNLSRDQIINGVIAVYISDPQVIIKTDYENLCTAFNHDAPDAHTQNGRNKALQLCDAILDASGDNIDLQLSKLHSGMVGDTVLTTGFLDACTNVLIDRAIAGEDVLECYMVLENAFAELVGVQYAGLLLMAEALHFRNDDINNVDKVFVGTVEEYHAKFTRHIEAQVEKFLTCVDRLVVSRFDVRTNLACPVQVLADHTGTVYERADFLAQLLSSKHQAGFIVRLIGTPQEVHDAVNAGVTATERIEKISCYEGWKEGGECTGTRSITTTTIPFSVVPIYGKPINLYSAHLPNYYSNKGYFEWSVSGGNKNVFHLQKNVAVAKLKMGEPLPSTTQSECYPCGSTGTNGYYDKAWSLGPGIRGPVAGNVNDVLRVYDDDFVESSDGTSYANRVFPLHRLPGLWQTTTQWNTPQGNNFATHTFDASSMKIAEHISVYDFSSESYYRVTRRRFNYSVGFLESFGLSPLGANDGCTVTVAARSKIKASYQHNKLGETGVSLGQRSELGTAAGQDSVLKYDGPWEGAGGRSLDPIDTGEKRVSCALASGAESTLRLQHPATGHGWYNENYVQPDGKFVWGVTTLTTTEGQIEYSTLELFPAP